VEQLSRQLQRERSQANYLTPIVAGVGEGGALAAVTLAEAPPATIDGAVSIDPTPAIPGRQPLCVNTTPNSGAGGFRYALTGRMEGFWSVGFTAEANKAVRDQIDELRRRASPIAVQEFPGAADKAQAVVALVTPHIVADRPKSGDVSDLPLIELPASHPSDLLVIVLSGDGGWRDLDKTIAEMLQAQGMSVVGWDSLRYFWSKKSAEETANDLARVQGNYMARWHATKVALVGYSFGADVLPFVVSRLPPDLRSRIESLNLIGLSPNASFEINVAGWLPGSSSGDRPVVPELAKDRGLLTRCFYGEGESDTACPGLADAEALRVGTGHHLGGRYGEIADDILASR
jgi:type IV secretory pathway VirJ component